MEIKPTDLRIGNWIKDHTGLNNVVKMIGVGWVKFIDDEACAFDLCSGIPLTEELLLKMGFVRFGNYYHNKIDEGFSIVTRAGLFYVCWDDKNYLIQVGTVHALQNAFYLLTGQELTLS